MHDALFTQAGRAGVYRLPPDQNLAALPSLMQRLRFAGFTADLTADKTLPTVLESLGKALGFPEWYGRNLDALHDCLTDPDWLPGPGLAKGGALVLSGLDTLRGRHPADFTRLIEVLASAVEIQRDSGIPLWVLVAGDARDLPLLPDA